VLHAVARAAAAARDWDTATLAYEQLIRRNPSDPGAYAGLAEVYVNQWQKGEAIALYQEAAQANPDMAWPHLELGKLYQRQTAQQP
jgi:tetratricopeptide (TPR) repeat protein